MGRACSTHGIEYVYSVLVGNSEMRAHNVDVDWKLIFMQASGRWDGGMD
jgi:hypothetical protein